MISVKNPCCDFNLDCFCLVGAVASFIVGSRAGILAKFFYWK